MCECDLGEVGEASNRVGDVGEAEGRRCEGAPVEDVVVEIVVAVVTVPGCLRFCPLLNLLAFSSFWGNESSTSAMWIVATVVGVACGV